MKYTFLHTKLPLRLVSFCLIASAFLLSCVEEIELSTQNFESLLVVEANITNELKQQEIRLSRTFRFEDRGPSKETNASVIVLTGNDTARNFTEVQPGVYRSNQSFAAEEGVSYSLQIQTQDGKNYKSTPVELEDTAEIESIAAVASQDSFGNPGVSILVNSKSNSGKGLYYRYEYEETYKIIAPLWKSDDFVTVGGNGCGVSVAPRTREERECFKTEKSIDIILGQSIGQPNGELENLETYFLDANMTKIAHRYSALLKQYVISSEVHSYFEKRRNLSSSENLFSQTQPGFLEGNITSVDAPNEEQVIGIFYVSTVTEKRFFFNWVDLFPDQRPPQIFCRITSPPLTDMAGNCILKSQVEANFIRYWDENLEPNQGEGPYLVVRRQCGDCTVLGDNVVPEFWVE